MKLSLLVVSVFFNKPNKHSFKRHAIWPERLAIAQTVHHASRTFRLARADGDNALHGTTGLATALRFGKPNRALSNAVGEGRFVQVCLVINIAWGSTCQAGLARRSEQQGHPKGGPVNQPIFSRAY